MRQRKPKLKRLVLQIETDQGTYGAIEWTPGKRINKLKHQSSDPEQWLKDCLAMAKEPYPELMGS